MDLNEQILKVIAEFQTTILAKKYLRTINDKISEQEEIIEILRGRMEDESSDVEKIEAQSRNVLFNKILGIGTAQLEIEKQEYLHSVLMYKDAIETLKPLKFEKEILEEKVEKFNDQRALLEKLIVRRDKELIKLGKKKYSAILNSYRELDRLTKFAREIFEAKDIGLKCKRRVNEILSLFKKAAEVRDWGQLDYGISNYSSEKTLIDKAVEQFHYLKVDLIKFEEELEDVHEHKKVQFLSNTIKFESFIKSYNNYLINDWVVRKKISSILTLMEALKDDIVRLLSTLDQKQRINTQRKEKNEINRNEILHNQRK